MKKFINFIVDKRLIIFIVMMVLTIAGGIVMNFVNINKDMTKYLPKNSDMRKGLDIMETQFPETTENGEYKIMFENLLDEEKQTVYDELLTLDGIQSVTYEIGNEKYNKDNHTLYVVTTEYTADNDVEKCIKSASNHFDDKYTVYTYYANAEDSVLNFIIPIALVIVVVILLLMCRSYFEPVLIIATIAAAVLLNMGTNIIFPFVSDMTYSIAAILQLILSIDYSIMLIHRYTQEKTLLAVPDKEQAMKNALHNSFGSISSSSLTTFVGLLALLIMSFTIGMDMGLVLAKGVLLSLICTFTVLPSLVLWSDKLLDKTDKHNIAEKIKAKRTAKKEAKSNAQ